MGNTTATSTPTATLLWWTSKKQINGFRKGVIEINGRNNAALISDPLHPCWRAKDFKTINRPLTDEAVYYSDPDWLDTYDISTDGTFVALVKMSTCHNFYWRGTLYSSSVRYKIFRAYDGAEIDRQPENGFIHVDREWDRENNPREYRPNVPVQSIQAVDEEGNYFLIYKGILYGPFPRDFWNDCVYVVDEDLYYNKLHIGQLPEEVDVRISKFIVDMPEYQHIPSLVCPFEYIERGIYPVYHLPDRFNDTENLIFCDDVTRMTNPYRSLPDLPKFRENVTMIPPEAVEGIKDTFSYDGYTFTSWEETKDKIYLFSVKNKPIVLDRENMR